MISLKRYCSLAIIVWLVMILAITGCTLPSHSTSDKSDIVQSLIAKYLKTDFSVCDTSQTTGVYNSIPDSEMNLLSSYLNRIQFSVVLASADSATEEYAVTLQYPDLDSVLRVANEDAAFLQDYSKLDTDDSKQTYLLEYLANILRVGSYTYNSYTCTLNLTGNYLIADDSELLNCYRYFANYDFSINPTIADNSNGQIPDSEAISSIPCIDGDKCFVVCYENINYLIYDIKVYTGQDAISQIQALSQANKVFDTVSDSTYYLEYSVKNLSQHKGYLPCGFVLSDGSGQLYTLTRNVVGLTSELELEPGEDGQLSQFLAGPADCQVYWYLENSVGIYRLNTML